MCFDSEHFRERGGLRKLEATQLSLHGSASKHGEAAAITRAG
eukprot:CAMPEP_0171086288 /NCGR_PEP_ID=MMETSP0766_2-20121228/19456_1 /TAXON_ID=439317 /ORGANISM="Gambierdiscus australes, Strain CAWD 149" /LENGTH=41 /DNA_ID= /DNA_START= /DNA_END= /DNA_ORIENTATION=